MAGRHPAPAVSMDPGGEAAGEPTTCDRCGDLATRSYEGREFLDLCEDCHTALGRWLDAGR